MLAIEVPSGDMSRINCIAKIIFSSASGSARSGALHLGYLTDYITDYLTHSVRKLEISANIDSRTMKFGMSAL